MQDFLKPKTSYRKLISYQKAECIYDLTYHFLSRFIEKRDRTYDQMLQAARSGKQNIVEGRSAAATSRETEIKLYNVAKASLQELLVDYEDYLRTRGHEIWGVSHPRFAQLRKTCFDHNDTSWYVAIAPRCQDFELANMVITLIHQTDIMIGKLIGYSKEDFLRNGGAREEMTRARLEYRNARRM